MSKVLVGDESPKDKNDMNKTDLKLEAKSPTETLDEKVETNPQKNVVERGKKELGGPKGLEPTRYGDWESKGRCYDF